jgi:hypothetical protein
MAMVAAEVFWTLPWEFESAGAPQEEQKRLFAGICDLHSVQASMIVI